MASRTARAVLLSSLGCLVVAGIAYGEHWDEGFEPPSPFALRDAPIGGVKPATGAPAYLASSRIAAVGSGALVSDADSGQLILTDDAGARRASLSIGADAGLLVYDAVARRAYVADRSGDRVVVVEVGGAGDSLVQVASWKTPAEPYGVALTPDRTTLLVTTIADRTLVAYDVDGGRQRFRAALDPEPRGLAVSPDGSRVLVASLASGSLVQLALDERRAPRRIALPSPARGQRARGAFAIGFVGELAVAPYQLETPVAAIPDTTGQYGGSSTPPLTHHLAFLAEDGARALAETNVHEPRALAWDASRDTLYLAGLASDGIVAVQNASQVDVRQGSVTVIGSRCGADGLAIGADGTVLVWCSFTRSVARLAPTKPGVLAATRRGPELAASNLDAQRHLGMVLFHTANEHLSGFAGMSCGNCHLDGRADGLSWRIGTHELQTPVLAGRIAGTAPYKWDGGAKDLPGSLRATIKRLGGSGLSKRDLAALTAFVETMPAIRAPTREPSAVARGQTLFQSAELGCTTCHDGSALTDLDQHELGGRAGGVFDTPGLAALAASAPYFHDGSAATLEEVLRDRGRVHGMSDAARELTQAQLADLIAFLETR